MADDIILEPKLIAREYLRKWFTLDIISSLPLDYILLAFDNGTEQIAQADGSLLDQLPLTLFEALIPFKTEANPRSSAN
ncbi:unnamed protein product [Hydatigera taeniaeformis]|uniref:Uncharacterized protein n=1 Tax=Hydatigena taeniaeformis TaxID=6205 RepID=A0A0R3WYQ9_HYDTA|nr:unnamed protein product [Hydatigera taeniaeformis]